MKISLPLAITLITAIAWTTTFLHARRPPLRDRAWLGILVCYCAFPAFVLIGGIGSAAFTWLLFSALGALLLTASERFGAAQPERSGRRLGISALISILFDWPVLIPETIESFLSQTP